MKLNLQNIENSFFNESDYYICYDAGIKLLFISQMFKFNGFWYTKYGLQYKASTLLTQNCNELYGKEISWKNLNYHGKITKFQQPHKIGSDSSIGVSWYNGTQVKNHGLATFWVNIENLEFKL